MQPVSGPGARARPRGASPALRPGKTGRPSPSAAQGKETDYAYNLTTSCAWLNPIIRMAKSDDAHGQIRCRAWLNPIMRITESDNAHGAIDCYTLYYIYTCQRRRKRRRRQAPHAFRARLSAGRRFSHRPQENTPAAATISIHLRHKDMNNAHFAKTKTAIICVSGRLSVILQTE